MRRDKHVEVCICSAHLRRGYLKVAGIVTVTNSRPSDLTLGEFSEGRPSL